MKKLKSTKTLKAIARERLLGHYGTTISALILYRFISFLIVNIIVGAIIPNNLITYLIYFGATILVNLFFGVFESGIAYLFMNIVYGQSASVGDLFHGFQNHPDKAIILQIPIAVMDTLTMIPIQVLSVILATNAKIPGNINPQITFTVVGIIAVLVILNIYVRLMFSQSYYILQDFPEKSATSILKTSARLMKGNKGKLFLLYLSFIPMGLIGMLACFIPFFWVTAYLVTSDAAFYQDLVSVSADNSGI
ncbi:DUF975 family protein [Butyrivibrio sp. JL13D10]|uniref:DUF975 family protein n=1 Tax=Butyrivibrio sp. JL13D10 TaxID=3236815 RepID=UPI0038B5D55B